MSGRTIALAISDVDGTLVATGRGLTPRRRCVRSSSSDGRAQASPSPRHRPLGLRGLVERLGLRLPMGAFDGASIAGPELGAIEESLIPEPTAREAMDRLAAGLGVWVFADGAWWLGGPDGPCTDPERRTLQAEPTIVADLAPMLGWASKVVGVSADPDRLAAGERALGAALGTRAVVHRSQACDRDGHCAGRREGGSRPGGRIERCRRLRDGRRDADLGLKRAADAVAPGSQLRRQRRVAPWPPRLSRFPASFGPDLA